MSAHFLSEPIRTMTQVIVLLLYPVQIKIT